MMDILQYVPYALFVAAVLLLLGGGLTYTLLFFKRANKRITG